MTRLFSLLSLFLFSGCAHKPTRLPTGLTAAGFWKEQGERKGRTESISAKLHLRYQSRAGGVSGRGRMLSQLPKYLRLEMRDPLGRVAYVVSLQGENFTAYYPSQKRAYTDKQSGAAYMKQFLGVSLTFKDLDHVLVGLVPSFLNTEKFDSWEWISEDGIYRGKAKRDSESLSCDVDPDTGALRALDWLGNGDVVHVSYSDFSSCCGGEAKGAKPLSLAHVVSVSIARVDSKVEAEWDDVEHVDEPKGTDAFQLSLGPDVQKVFLP
jgi:hypothetical protein